MATTSRRPSFESKRSTIAANLGPNNEEDPATTGHTRHHKPKQFVVHRERHHTRVPSHSKNLNKLSKLTTTTAATAATTTTSDNTTGHRQTYQTISPRGKSTIIHRDSSSRSQSKAGDERQADSTKRATFEIGESDAEEDDQVHEILTKSPKKASGLANSSSTRPLDRQLKEAKAKKEPPKELDKDGDSSKQKDRQRQEEPEPQQQHKSERRMANVRLSQAETLVDCDKSPPSLLFSQQTNASAALPKINAECINGLHTPVSANPTSGSFPNHQALTSRFLDSPGRSGASISPSHNSASRRPPSPPSSGPDKPSSQAHSPPPASSATPSQTTAVPSRTQQKLWLQRASSQFDEGHQINPKKSGSGGDWAGFSIKEFERISKEYYNVRRFKDPVGEALDRIRDNPKLQARIPRKGTRAAAQEAGMGLSQSLNSGFGRTPRNQDKAPKGSRDDSGVKSTTIPQRDPNVQALLLSMWNQAQPIGLNE